MDRIKKYYITSLYIIFSFMFVTCSDDEINNPTPETIEFLGFEDKYASALEIDGSYLYACAASKGLWRRNLGTMEPWTYLGLADSSLGNYANVGVLDVEANGNDILVAYNEGQAHIEPINSVGIYRSLDKGETWIRSDYGIPQSITDTNEYNGMYSIKRSIHQPGIVLSMFAPIIYRSTDNGNYWNLVFGRRGTTKNRARIQWHPYKEGEVWMYGEDSFFNGFLFNSTDFGRTFGNAVNFIGLGLPFGTIVNNVVYNKDSLNVIITVTSAGIIRTVDGGVSWGKFQIYLPEESSITCIIDNPNYSDTYYISANNYIYKTTDNFTSTEKLFEIPEGSIRKIIFNDNSLVINSTKGIYLLRLSYIG